MSKTYYCTKCEQKHITAKAVGQSHLEFKGTAPAKAPESDEEIAKRTVNLCATCAFQPAECGSNPQFGTGTGNDNVYACDKHHVEETPEPTAPEVTCTICNDTGMVDLGVQARGFCKCGQETHDERIGLMPRRSTTPRTISDEDRVEADYRRTHGGSHDEYLALGTDGGGGG